MIERKHGGIQFFSYERFERYPNITNIVTTRHGGRSEGPFSSFNLSFRVGDDPDVVLENRAILAQMLGVDPESLTTADQVHETSVVVVDGSQKGKGAVNHSDAIARTDAMITTSRDTPLMVSIADCVAVSLYDPEKGVIGIAHAGWRGTLSRIAEKTVKKMASTFGSNPSDIAAGISPSIGRCHLEVDEEIHHTFAGEFGKQGGPFLGEDMDGTCYVDLWGLNRLQLVECGLDSANVDVAAMCTVCDSHLFFSHRHDSGTTGRQAAVIMLHGIRKRGF